MGSVAVAVGLVALLALCVQCSAFAGRGTGRLRAAAISLQMVEGGPVRIGTRGSPLALAQAFETKRLLQLHFPELQHDGAIEIRKIMTKGDSILNQALSEIGGKGLFTKELDEALMANEVDICVHSMKDVPTWLPEGTILPCMLQREDTNDVFISKKYRSISELPSGAVVGSASLRRQAQLLAINPSLKVVNFRGNVQTRLSKIESDVVDATLLALAGLKRLGMQDVIAKAQTLSWEELLPAVAQGAIGIQCRADDSRANELLAALNHAPTKLAVDCERAFLANLDGNCRTPIAGQAKIVGDELVFRGLLSKPDGQDMIRVSMRGKIDQAAELGNAAGQEIRRIAGDKFASYQEHFAKRA